MAKKYTRADLRDDFVLTIQVSTKNDMTVTTNEAPAPDITSMRLHGINLAGNAAFGPDDHAGLEAFCKSYLDARK